MKSYFAQGGAVGRLVLVLLMVTLTACHSGWDKDPFAKEGDNIKNAIQPDEEIPKVPPPASNTLFVQMDQVYSVVEGETLEIPITWEIAHEEVELTNIEVQGLQDKFPGAEFVDLGGNKRMIRITPGFDFVPVDTPYIVQPITVSFFNEYKGQVQEVKRTVVIHVIPQNSSAPQIEKIELSPSNDVVVAGISKKITVKVFDTNKEFSPRVGVTNSPKTSLQGAQFINIDAEGTYNSTDDVWEFEGTIRIPSDYYQPANLSSVYVDFWAYSITGIPSRNKEYRFSIESQPTAPKIVSEPTIYFETGIENQYTFSAFDIRGAGRVSTRCEKQPVGMTCNCRPGTGGNIGIHYCTVTWSPETAGDYTMDIIAVNQIGSKKQDKTMNVIIKVEETP